MSYCAEPGKIRRCEANKTDVSGRSAGQTRSHARQPLQPASPRLSSSALDGGGADDPVAMTAEVTAVDAAAVAPPARW